MVFSNPCFFFQLVLLMHRHIQEICGSWVALQKTCPGQWLVFHWWVCHLLLATAKWICQLKWLLYQSLFKSTWQCVSPFERALALGGLCVLSIVGGLAIAALVKAMGVAFLGNSRSKLAANAKECDYSMLCCTTIAGGCLRFNRDFCRQGFGCSAASCLFCYWFCPLKLQRREHKLISYSYRTYGVAADFNFRTPLPSFS